MSLSATTRAYAARPRDPVAKLILIRLADFADEDDRADIDSADLSTFAMCPLEDVWGCIRQLVDDGFLSEEKDECSGDPLRAIILGGRYS